MTIIIDPKLFVEKVEGHPGRRRLVVSYELDLQPPDRLLAVPFTERVVVTARDLHDAPQRAHKLEVRFEQDAIADRVGRVHRTVETGIDRSSLDVQQDWWRTDHGGGVDPIAEFPDHFIAELSLVVGDAIVAEATTPVVTGSWGALGED